MSENFSHFGSLEVLFQVLEVLAQRKQAWNFVRRPSLTPLSFISTHTPLPGASTTFYKLSIPMQKREVGGKRGREREGGSFSCIDVNKLSEKICKQMKKEEKERMKEDCTSHPPSLPLFSLFWSIPSTILLHFLFSGRKKKENRNSLCLIWVSFLLSYLLWIWTEEESAFYALESFFSFLHMSISYVLCPRLYSFKLSS